MRPRRCSSPRGLASHASSRCSVPSPCSGNACARGTVDEVLVLGSGDDAVGGPGLTVWHPDAEAGRTGESLVAQLQSLWKTDAEPPHSWESGPVDVPVAAIVAALGRLQPDLKLILATPLGQLGVCTVGGRVVSAGLEGQAMLRDAAVTGDASLKLVLDLWGESQTHLAPQAQLHGELGLVCEYAELFAASAGFVDHLERVLATTLSLRVSAIHAESHAPSSFGVSALELLKRGLGRLPAPARGALIPAGVLRAARIAALAARHAGPATVRTPLLRARGGRDARRCDRYESPRSDRGRDGGGAGHAHRRRRASQEPAGRGRAAKRVQSEATHDTAASAGQADPRDAPRPDYRPETRQDRARDRSAPRRA